MADFTKSVPVLNSAVVGVVTNSPITDRFVVEHGKAFRFDVGISGYVAGGTKTLTLQASYDGSTWVATKTATVTANGQYTFKFLEAVAGDQTYLPFPTFARVVITMDNALDEVVVDRIVYRGA
jgi:hypothetical protein